MMARIAIVFIRLYQMTLSPFLGEVCRFEPSCSRYAVSCFQGFGFLRGARLTVLRLLRCHPWHPGGYDPPPLPGPDVRAR